MGKISEQDIERIVKLLKEGESLPVDYKTALFNVKKEYELIYADKEREEDILSDTMVVPLQRVKTFNSGKGDSSWNNMLIFGDNLQVLKTLLQMKQEGKLRNADGTSGVRLIYIDPPFATRQEFKGSQDQKAYQDKIAGAKFIEFLRKRLVFLRELLSENGSIYIHLDWRKCHYIKTILDEIIGESNFQNEIIWQRLSARSDSKSYNHIHEVIYFYVKSQNFIFNTQYTDYSENYINKFYRFKDEDGRLYSLSDLTARGISHGETGKPWKDIEPSKLGNHWKVKLKTLEELDKQGKIYWPPKGRMPRLKMYLNERKGRPLQSIWTDISLVQFSSSENMQYPTQKPEALLERLIKSSTNENDIVLDAFAGSGTTGAVAEKLDRRWIMIDCGKLAIYTMQKRLLNLKDERKKPISYNSFTLYNAGLYDYKMIKELPWDQYRDFALRLFQCRNEKHEISKIELDGYLGADNVMVFNYQKYRDAMLNRGFIDDLHKNLRTRIGKRFFIIAPAASVQFLEDYIDKGIIKYFILRIPYSIIEEIHNRGFTKIKQPVSEMDVNDTVDSVGFDFIQVPVVKCKYFVDEPKNTNLLNQSTKECVIKIEKFESNIISRKPIECTNFETLSMVMLDYDFNGEVFDLDEVFYAEDLKKIVYEVRFSKENIKGQIMIIYIDTFGNEKREIKTLSDFRNMEMK